MFLLPAQAIANAEQAGDEHQQGGRLRNRVGLLRRQFNISVGIIVGNQPLLGPAVEEVVQDACECAIELSRSEVQEFIRRAYGRVVAALQ